MRYRDKFRSTYVDSGNIFGVLDDIENRLGDIMNELETLEGDERDDIDIDIVRELVGKLKDDLY